MVTADVRDGAAPPARGVPPPHPMFAVWTVVPMTYWIEQAIEKAFAWVAEYGFLIEPWSWPQ